MQELLNHILTLKENNNYNDASNMTGFLFINMSFKSFLISQNLETLMKDNAIVQGVSRNKLGATISFWHLPTFYCKDIMNLW